MMVSNSKTISFRSIASIAEKCWHDARLQDKEDKDRGTRVHGRGSSYNQYEGQLVEVAQRVLITV